MYKRQESLPAPAVFGFSGHILFTNTACIYGMLSVE